MKSRDSIFPETPIIHFQLKTVVSAGNCIKTEGLLSAIKDDVFGDNIIYLKNVSVKPDKTQDNLVINAFYLKVSEIRNRLERGIRRKIQYLNLKIQRDKKENNNINNLCA